MVSLKGMGNFFALDIGTNAVRVVQLTSSGQNVWHLSHYGYAPIDEKTSMSTGSESMRRLGEVIITAIGQSGVRDADVVVGLPSNKTFTTVIDMPMMSNAELQNTIKYQIDQYIPTNPEETKVDWAPLGPSVNNPQQQEILIASTTNSYAEQHLEFIEGLGLNVIAAEPSALAMVRALLPDGTPDARLIIDIGEQSTDLVVTYADNPRLIRTIPVGLKTFIKSAVQNLNIHEDQARQFILKFGLAPDRLEGQVYRALEGTLDSFVAEIVKSVKFFQTRYPSTPVGSVLLSGFAAVMPQLGAYLNTKIGLSSEIGNPWQRVHVSQSDQQQLAGVAAEFATAIGLAQRRGI
jgi:type IV pilus assembly protein PilM